MRLICRAETWPVTGVFRISRAEVRSVETLLVTVDDAGGFVGRGEGTPYAHFGWTMEGSLASLEEVRTMVEWGITRDELQDMLPAGAARNALDCALWDWEAKMTGVPVWRAAGLQSYGPITTAYTISVDEPEVMAARAAEASRRPLLKVKMGGGDDGREDLVRIAAVRQAAQSSALIVDANEAWDLETLQTLAPELADLGVQLIEQPLPAAEDECLVDYRGPVPLCADESCRDRSSLDSVVGRYQFINIKLDKTGGLTEALRLAEEAHARGLGLMVGCMLGTSLAMAPGTIIGARATFVDLDGPLLLAEDRIPGIHYEGSVMYPPPADVWGWP